MSGVRWIGISVLVLAVSIGTSHAWSQDQAADPTETAEQPQRSDENPERLRAALKRRLASIEEQETRLRDILGRLDAGESPAAVFAELRERGELGLLGSVGDRGRDGGRTSRMMGTRGSGAQVRGTEPLTEEQFTLWRNRIMAFFEENAPEMAARLREAGDSDEARGAVQRLRREVERLMELRERDSEEFRPALQRLRNGMRIADILGRVRRAAGDGSLTEGQLVEVRQELATIVAQQYDAQLTSRRIFLERTSRRLENARETFERERADRESRIESEVDAMLERATRRPNSQGRSERRQPR